MWKKKSEKSSKRTSPCSMCAQKVLRKTTFFGMCKKDKNVCRETLLRSTGICLFCEGKTKRHFFVKLCAAHIFCENVRVNFYFVIFDILKRVLKCVFQKRVHMHLGSGSGVVPTRACWREFRSRSPGLWWTKNRAGPYSIGMPYMAQRTQPQNPRWVVARQISSSIAGGDQRQHCERHPLNPSCSAPPTSPCLLLFILRRLSVGFGVRG